MQQGKFVIHDTRLSSGRQTELPLARDEAIAMKNQQATRAKLQHQAMSTGVPGWCVPPPVPHDKADCRMVEIALTHDNSYTRQSTWRNSWTSRTGVHPYRPTFGDRIHSLLALVSTAYSLQRAKFDELQRMYQANAEHAGIDCAPDDVMLFEFNMPWKALRTEIATMLGDHVAAVNALRDLIVGSVDHQQMNNTMQRTSPETIVLALSGMSIFDASKWGADCCPYDEEEYDRIVVASTNNIVLRVDSPSRERDEEENEEEFMPTQHAAEPSPYKSCAMSPATTGVCSNNSSFFPAHDHAPSAGFSAPNSRRHSPSTDVSEGAQHNASFPKVPSLHEDLEDKADNGTLDPVVADEEDIIIVDDDAADFVRDDEDDDCERPVSPPPRPPSLAACLNPADVQERQAASVAYRMRVLQRALHSRLEVACI